MPPSGYSQTAVLSIQQYLEACASDLSQELKEGANPEDILRREIETIENAVAAGKFSTITNETMLLIQAFYRTVLSKLEGNIQFENASSETIIQTTNELKNLKI